MPGKTTETDSLLNRLPDLEKGKMPAVDAGLADTLTRKLQDGGEELVLDLVSSIDEVDNGGDWKARFALHTLVMAAGAPERAAQRGMLAGLLLKESGGDRPVGVRVFLLSQLRLIADARAVTELIGLLGGNEPGIVDAAATVLASIGKDALPALRDALKGTQGPQGDTLGHAIMLIEGH